MKEIIYLKGDATEPVGNGIRFIAHVCNNKGGWGAGFVLALSKKWQEPEIIYRNSIKQGQNLGDISIAYLKEDIIIINMIAQEGYVSKNNPIAIRYEALEKCFKKMLKHITHSNATLHMPRIGCGLAGGKWEKIEPIIKRCFSERNIQVYIYDLK